MPAKQRRKTRIVSFALEPGDVVAGKYIVTQMLGCGWEGEVYKIVERGTGVERAAKLFFPHRNARNATARRYAVKLHKLRHCSVVIQYHTQDRIEFDGQPVSILISEYVEGEPLGELLRRQPGRALAPFEALHLLHALASGMAEIHRLREYHGDLHLDNIMVRRFGLRYEVKVIDPFHSVASRRENIQNDVCDLIRVFYDVLGGARRYSRHRAPIKAICCGLKRTLIVEKFRTAGHLRDHLENMEWS